MITRFFEMLSGFVFDLLNMFVGLLPPMPFNLDAVNAFLSNNIVVAVLQWVNYFVPVEVCCGILALWSTAMLGYVGIKMAVNYSGSLGR